MNKIDSKWKITSDFRYIHVKPRSCNIVLNPANDKKGGNINLYRGTRYRKELNTFIDTFNLNDIWRIKNNEKFGFTWHCKKTKIFCRLDYWLISDHLVNNIKKSDIYPTTNSDHKIIYTSLQTSKNI